MSEVQIKTVDQQTVVTDEVAAATETANEPVEAPGEVTEDPSEPVTTPSESTVPSESIESGHDGAEPTASAPEEGSEPAEDQSISTNDDNGRDQDGHDSLKSDMVDKAAEHNKLRIVTKALKNIERDLANVVRLLESSSSLPAKETVQLMTHTTNAAATAVANVVKTEAQRLGSSSQNDGRVIEGVFDGQNMVGSDGKSYTVPANYASKSKLVEGDMLKLTITPRGSFIYKQIGPIERTRVIATLGFDQTIGEYYAVNESRRWNTLKASVTYYRGDPGDEVVLLVPKSAPSKWAAVENIIKSGPAISTGADMTAAAPAPDMGTAPAPVAVAPDSAPEEPEAASDEPMTTR